MKIKLCYVFLFLFLFLMVMTFGCSNEKKSKQVMICNLNSNNKNASITSVYKVFYKNNIVESVELTEEMLSEDEEILNTMLETTKNTYYSLNEAYGGYTYEVNLEDGKIVSYAIIDYSNMNLEKLLKDKQDMSDYVNSDNKLTKEGIQSMYESIGAICK